MPIAHFEYLYLCLNFISIYISKFKTQIALVFKVPHRQTQNFHLLIDPHMSGRTRTKRAQRWELGAQFCLPHGRRDPVTGVPSSATPPALVRNKNQEPKVPKFYAVASVPYPLD